MGAWAPGLGPTGPKLYDVSRNGNHGIPSAGGWPAWAVNDGYALDFAGDVGSQQVNCGSAAGNLLTASEVSVSAWAVSRANTGFRGIVSWDLSSPFYFSIRWSSTNKIEGYGIGVDFNPGSAWFHVCATKSQKDNVRRLYINGVLMNQGGSGAPFPSTADSFYIGCDYDGSANSRMWSGLIDAVSIHHRALSQDEIRALAAHRLLAYIPRRRTVRRSYSIPAAGFNPSIYRDPPRHVLGAPFGSALGG